MKNESTSKKTKYFIYAYLLLNMSVLVYIILGVSSGKTLLVCLFELGEFITNGLIETLFPFAFIPFFGIPVLIVYAISTITTNEKN